MQSKMNLSFSIFLMLMLTQVALSVPVDKNVANAQTGDAELHNQKLSDWLKELAETSKKFEEEFKNIVKQEIAGVNAKVNDISKQVNLPEIKKKFEDFLNEVSKISPEELVEKFREKVNNLVKQGLARIKDKADSLINQINSAETKKKLQDLKDELNRQEEKIKEELEKFLERELPAAKAKAEDLLKEINSGEAQKKIQALIKDMSDLTPAEFYDKLTEILKNLPKQIGGKN